LKTGGVEVTREKWDEAMSGVQDVNESMDVPGDVVITGFLPDWTRTPLPVGAPPVAHIPRKPQAPVSA